MPAFANGCIDDAFDELFGNPMKIKRATINIDSLKEVLARVLVGKVYSDDLLTTFIDIVSDRIATNFCKTHFVAAMRYYAVKFRP